MPRLPRALIAGLALIALALAVPGRAVPDGDRFHGVVVDTGTRVPLAGAVVVAVWYRRPIVRMDGPVYFHDAREVVTDARGAFSLDDARRIDWNPFTYVEKPVLVISAPGYIEFPTGYAALGTAGSPAWYETYEALLRRERVTVALPPVPTLDALRRFATTSSHTALVPHDRIPRYLAVVNANRARLGLPPY